MSAVLDNPRTDGVSGESGGVMNVEPLHEVLAMLLDGLETDAEFRRYSLVGFAFDNQLVSIRNLKVSR
jgi:hypothetical protein